MQKPASNLSPSLHAVLPIQPRQFGTNALRRLYCAKEDHENDVDRVLRVMEWMHRCNSQARVHRFLELLHEEYGRTGAIVSWVGTWADSAKRRRVA